MNSLIRTLNSIVSLCIVMKNNFKILGCSMSVGKGGYTTCFQINDDILIDAGSGLLDQDFDELKNINKIFLTHSHLDHINWPIYIFTDLVGNYRDQPIEVFGSNDTIINIKKNIFNGVIWMTSQSSQLNQNPT